MLFFLAIDAGTFCAPKVAGLIAEQAKRYVIEDPSLSLENTILVALQQKRKRIFDGMYERDLRPILRFCWMENQHSYNTASNLLEEPFGLNNLSAQNDGASRTSFLDRLFFYYISGFRAERTLWEQHEYTDICDLMSELHENNQLPRDKTTTFLKKWIEAQPIEQSIKATYLADLDNGRLFGQKIMLNGFVKPNFVKFILYGMGIINLPT